MLDIELFDNPQGGEFVIQESGNRMAEMVFTKVGTDRISIDHTFVDPHVRGNRLGFELFRESVNFARENNLKIIPLCPYVRAEFERNPQFADVLAR